MSVLLLLPPACRPAPGEDTPPADPAPLEAETPPTAPPPAEPVAPANAPSVYTEQPATRDGTGRVYMGREISLVMGHLAADWLERPSRETEELPDRVVAEMNLRPSDVVADIGAGTGYFSFRISPLVPEGRVLAVDIQPEMLEMIAQRAGERGVTNVEGILGEIDDTKLPENSVDVALMVDAYHEFSHPHEMVASIVKALRPGGRIVLVEYRGEDPAIMIKPLHKMTEAQARREMEAAGLAWVETKEFLPSQHFMVFQKPRPR